MSFSSGPGATRFLAQSGQQGSFRGAMSLPPLAFAGLNVDNPQQLGASWRGQIGTLVYRYATQYGRLGLTGISRDSTGAILGNATLYLVSLPSYTLVAQTVSDASGNFRFDILPPGPYQIQAYQSGSPDLAGASVNTLQPT